MDTERDRLTFTKKEFKASAIFLSPVSSSPSKEVLLVVFYPLPLMRLTPVHN